MANVRVGEDDPLAGAVAVERAQAKLPKTPLGITIDVPAPPAKRLNAVYTRGDLRFFHTSVAGTMVFTGESPDVVCHEMGHAVLDALRPQLWDAMSHEVAAFHESFGDMSAIIVALQQPSIRDEVLAETGGALYRSSRLSRVAEQLGWGQRQRQPCSAEGRLPSQRGQLLRLPAPHDAAQHLPGGAPVLGAALVLPSVHRRVGHRVRDGRPGTPSLPSARAVTSSPAPALNVADFGALPASTGPPPPSPAATSASTGPASPGGSPRWPSTPTAGHWPGPGRGGDRRLPARAAAAPAGGPAHRGRRQPRRAGAAEEPPLRRPGRPLQGRARTRRRTAFRLRLPAIFLRKCSQFAG